MLRLNQVAVFLLVFACAPKVQQSQADKKPKDYEFIMGHRFKVMSSSAPKSDWEYTSHYYRKVITLKNAEILLNDLERKLEIDGYRFVASTKDALTLLLYRKKTAKFVFYNDAKSKQVDLWFERIFPVEDRYLKGVDLHIAVRVLASNQPQPNLEGVKQ